MAIDNAEKRKSASGVPFLPLGPAVTPNASQDQEWRQQSGWGYSGIAAEGPVVEVPVRGGGFGAYPRLMRTAVVGRAKARRRKIERVRRKIAALEKRKAKSAPPPAPEVAEPIPAPAVEPPPAPQPIILPVAPDFPDADMAQIARDLEQLYAQMALMQRQAALDEENDALEILLLVA